ncbi:GyrI-like domain-containing protein [Ureibacillus sp. GCM10028918]|uniref:GyrI-like domain-containing protein n=1 Tax=Ureibacillus sp. GCM10028918 TaxID=3273429 RepID=UPI00360D9957
MEYKTINKNFKVVGFKGRGAFDNFAEEVPALSKQVLSRTNEIENHLGIEIALFEPIRDSSHRVGDFFVGLLVNDSLNTVPAGMEFIEINQQYVTARDKISNISSLHSYLLQWANEQGHARNLESYIVETYHPVQEGEEEVRIYLPIY